MAVIVLACHSIADVPQGKMTEEDAVLPLPRWSEQEIQAFRENLPGEAGALLPATDGMTDNLLNTPLPFGPRLDQGGTGVNSEILPRLRPEDMRLFLPESLLGAAEHHQTQASVRPTPLSALKIVPPEFLAVATNALPQEYLIDPGTLLTEVHQHDLARFLEFHAHDALIKLHVLILPGDHKLPADASLDAVCSGSLAKGSACLLVYPLGEPWRARLFLSKSVHDHASSEFMKETARACVEEALHTSDATDQLRDYAVELSTRLFWLQKALGTPLKQRATAAQPLSEIDMDAPSPAVAAEGQSNLPTTLAGIAVGVMVLGMLSRPARERWKQWVHLRRRNRVWMLPEVETIPRLGGAFTGGGGAMLSYAKPIV